MKQISEIREYLDSPNKQVRLKALKLVLGHPHATPLDLVKGLCSFDNRNFEFLDSFGLGPVMRAAWTRLRDVDDDAVYQYLDDLYKENPGLNAAHIRFILEQIGTARAAMLLRESYPRQPASE